MRISIIIYSIYLTTFVNQFAISNELFHNNLGHIKARYVINSLPCEQCCISAIKIINLKLIDYNIKDIKIFLDKKYKNIIPLLKKEKLIEITEIIDEISILNYSYNSYKDGLFLIDSSDNIIFLFPNFTNTILVTNTLEQYFDKKLFIINQSDSIIITNVLSPIRLSKNNSVQFIIPELRLIVSYNYMHNKFDFIYEFTKNDKFYFFDSTIHSIEYWNMTYDIYQDFIYPYIIYAYDGKNFKSIINIINDYAFDSSKQTVLWQRIYSIFDYNLNKTKIIPITSFSSINQSSNRIMTQLNDSLFVLSVNNLLDKQIFLILNSINDLIVDSLDVNINGKEFLFCSDKMGNFLVLDYDKKTLYHYIFSDRSLILANTYTKEILNINLKNIYDILTYKGRIFFVYYLGINENQLYIDEYTLNEFKYKRGFILNNSKDYTANNLFFDFRDDGLFIISSNHNGDWIIENFFINFDER